MFSKTKIYDEINQDLTFDKLLTNSEESDKTSVSDGKTNLHVDHVATSSAIESHLSSHTKPTPPTQKSESKATSQNSHPALPIQNTESAISADTLPDNSTSTRQTKHDISAGEADMDIGTDSEMSTEESDHRVRYIHVRSHKQSFKSEPCHQSCRSRQHRSSCCERPRTWYHRCNRTRFDRLYWRDRHHCSSWSWRSRDRYHSRRHARSPSPRCRDIKPRVFKEQWELNDGKLNDGEPEFSIKEEHAEMRYDIPDLIFCGKCHQSFSCAEKLKFHRLNDRRCSVLPIPPQACRLCAKENEYGELACAYCLKDFPSGWSLLKHIQISHEIAVCKQIATISTVDGKTVVISPPNSGVTVYNLPPTPPPSSCSINSVVDELQMSMKHSSIPANKPPPALTEWDYNSQQSISSLSRRRFTSETQEDELQIDPSQVKARVNEEAVDDDSRLTPASGRILSPVELSPDLVCQVLSQEDSYSPS